MIRHGKMFQFMLAVAVAGGLPPVTGYTRGTTPLGARQQAHAVRGSKRRGRRASNLYFARLLRAP